MAENRFVAWLKDYYRWCKEEREKELEPTWGMAFDAFRGDYSSQYLDRWRALEGHDWRSKVFVRFTRRKIVSAVSQIEDIIFQGGQLPYAISATPVPEDSGGLFLPPDIADKRSENMKKRIDDINIENKYERILRGSLLERAIYGMSVHKAPVIRKKEYLQAQFQVPALAGYADMLLGTQLAQKYGRHTLVPQSRMVPTVEHCNLWDVFWDMEAEDFQSGIGVIHRVMMSPGMVRRLEEQPGYDKSAIGEIIAQYSNSQNTLSRDNEDPKRKNLAKRMRGIEVVEFWGRVPKDVLGNRDEMRTIGGDGREVEVTSTVAFCSGSDGVEIRKALPNPLPLSHRPFHVGYWEEQPHNTSGIGMAENLKDAQMMINGAYRCFIDNKAFSSSLMMFYVGGAVKPGENLNPRVGGKIAFEDWVKDIRQVMQWVAPPDNGGGTLDLIGLAERFGDEDSGHPKLMQGETAKHSPKTAFETSQLLEAANKQIGKVIRNQDEGLIEPDIESLYHYLMVTDPDENIKGDFTCQATGFAGYNDKVIRSQGLMRLIQFTLSNQLTMAMLKIPDAVREAWRVSNFDPEQFLKTDDELEEEAASMAQSMIPPPIEGEIPLESMPQEPMPQRIPGRARGGPVSAGKPYVVGEEGPEIVVPEENGIVIPNNDIPRLTPISSEPQSITILPLSEEREFQKWARNLDFYKEFVDEHGEEPDLDTDRYDYRGAWKAGITPSRYRLDSEPNPRTGHVPPNGGRYHWGGFKNKNHPTYWMSEFMEYTGKDPLELGLKTREEGQEWLNRNYTSLGRGK